MNLSPGLTSETSLLLRVLNPSTEKLFCRSTWKLSWLVHISQHWGSKFGVFCFTSALHPQLASFRKYDTPLKTMKQPFQWECLTFCVDRRATNGGVTNRHFVKARVKALYWYGNNPKKSICKELIKMAKRKASPARKKASPTRKKVSAPAIRKKTYKPKKKWWIMNSFPN